MPRVTILPAGLVVDVADGTTLFDAGAKLGAGIETACVGKGTCGLCRVKIVSGGDVTIELAPRKKPAGSTS